MMVDLNEKELFALMVLVHKDFLDKRIKNVDIAFEEGLELKLVGALLKETGHTNQPISGEAAMRLIEEMRIKEESTANDGP